MVNYKRIVGFGASSMYGARDTEAGGFMNRLVRWAAETSPGTEVINRGIGGNTTFDMLVRIGPDVAAASPDLILFLPGINDVPRGDGAPRTPLDAYARNMKLIFERLSAIAPTVFITPYSVNCGQLRMSPEVLAAYLDAARRAAREFKITTIDLPALIREDEVAALWDADGLHFNAVGHERIFVLIREHLVGGR